jgi:hypothetical protein
MNPHSYAHIIFDKGAKSIQWKIASSTNVAGKSGYLLADNPILVSTQNGSRYRQGLP